MHAKRTYAFISFLPIITGALLQPQNGTHVGYFFTSVEDLNLTVVHSDAGKENLEAKGWLDGYQHFRLLPGSFPKGMHYHFDGLASVMQFTFRLNVTTKQLDIEYQRKQYESNLAEHYGRCLFVGSGTGPTLGIEPCVRNPAVNLLPISGQLWLTIDTSEWGRVDPVTLETFKKSKVSTSTMTLNAHPACDPTTNECFVQHPCAKVKTPATKTVCVSQLIAGTDDLSLKEIGSAEVSSELTIQHSHSPCITKNFIVSKLDSFQLRGSDHPSYVNAGMLNEFRQKEDNLWLVLDRSSSSANETTRILESNLSFVNNHFWNCFDSADGESIIVDTVAVTHDYLDTYFSGNLDAGVPNWDNMFKEPKRCVIPTTGNGTIICKNLLQDSMTIFDYPTFNPKYKMRSDYNFFYGISPVSKSSSRWFDRILKFSAKDGSVVGEWSEKGVYVTEADFIPNPSASTEDDGVLVTVIYNSTSDKSHFVIIDAQTMTFDSSYAMDSVIPFHAHGISCAWDAGAKKSHCYTNP